MVWCKNCSKDVEAAVEDTSGFSCCTECGKVLDDFHISSETTFYKGADGSSTAAGTFVSESGSMGMFGRVGGLGMYGEQDSREKTTARGRTEISNLAHSLNIRPRDQVIDSALRLYKLALHANFTRGRRTDQVAACCLYTVCRLEVKPYMLIDFSDALQVNVFTLGACLIPLLKVFRLHDHETITKPVDPSLYIHRFADRLSFGKKMQAVSATAIRLVKSMKRDWILSGRRPAGICGAALYISAHIHGFERSKRDVISVVHICSQTLTFRLLEFADTDSGSLTAEEFEIQAAEMDAEQEQMMAKAEPLPLPAPPPKEENALKGNAEGGAGKGEKQNDGPEKPGTPPPISRAIVTPRPMCLHMMNEGKPHFAHGMCHDCFVSYVTTTGGHFNAGAPPALSKKKSGKPKKQLETQQLERANSKLMPALEAELDSALMSKELQPLALTYPGGSLPSTPARVAPFPAAGSPASSAVPSPLAPPDASPSVDNSRAIVLARPAVPASGGPAGGGGLRPHTAEDELDGDDAAPALRGRADGAEPDGEAEDTFNDIDDTELEMYLNSKEEEELKGLIWHHINQDYLEKQAAKAAAIEAAKQVDEERRLAAALAGKTYEGNNGKRKYKKRQKVEMPEADSPAEAVIQAMSQKKASTKIDYEVLEDLFDDDAGEDSMTVDDLVGPEQHKPDYEMKQMVRDYIGQHRDELQATETAEEKRQRAALEADKRRPGRMMGLGVLGSSSFGARDSKGHSAKPRVGFSRMRPRAG